MSAITHSMRYGKEMSATEFIIGWAKLRGGFSHMRDDSSEAPIRLWAVSPHREADLKRSERELERYKNMTLEEAAELVEDDYNRSIQHQKNMNEQRDAQKKMYEDMLAEVDKWEPPTALHFGIKEDAISDLRSAIKDCEYSNIEYEKEDPQEYINIWINYYTNDVEKKKERLEDEKRAVAERNQWITDLLKSLEKTYED